MYIILLSSISSVCVVAIQWFEGTAILYIGDYWCSCFLFVSIILVR